jgi:hypothetical protein
MPTIDKNIVVWHLNKYASYIIGGVSIVYGLLWAYLFHQVAAMLENKVLKRRMKVFSQNGIIYGIAGSLLFVSNSALGQSISVCLFVYSAFLSAEVFLTPFLREYFKKSRSV